MVGHVFQIPVCSVCHVNAHPCALPHQSMKQRLEEDLESMKLLVLVMSFIGSLYAPSISSSLTEKQVRTELSKNQRQPTGFLVQALLLYSIAVYWSNEIERSLELLDNAIYLALELRMDMDKMDIHG